MRGTLQSKNYPDDYDNNTDRCWTLYQVSGHDQFKFYFDTLEIEYEGHCNYDYLQVLID